MNAGIKEARGDVIMPMGAHAVYSPSYISQLVTALEETGADNVGGVLVTLPANGTPLARALAVGLSHPFGVGDRKSTRLNSSHGYISYAVFCLKKKKRKKHAG